MISYNLVIVNKNPRFYEQADMIRMNSPWYTEEELMKALTNVNKPVFLDINIKEREKSKKANHSYKRLLEIASKYNVDWVGLSNVEGEEIYEEVKKILNNEKVKICAKIETELGCWHFDDIMSVFDGIMVDNEDLATNMGWKRASEEKDRIYDLCERNKKTHFRLAGVIFEHVMYPKVVYTYGAWDLLHPGHIKLLEKAKSYGDVLYVGVVGDEAIKELKGEGRPIQTQVDRIEIVGSLKCVDVVMSQKDYDPVPNMEKIKPSVLVKGDDWDIIPGVMWIEQHGGKLIKPSYSKEWSTSKIIKKVGDKDK